MGLESKSSMSQSPISTTPFQFKNDRRYLGDITWALAVICLYLAIQAAFLNGFCIRHFLRQIQDIKTHRTRGSTTPATLYTLISLTDFATALAALLVSLSLFLQRDEHLTASVLVIPAFFIYSITFKLSVFLNVVLAVVRTASILRPFYKPSCRTLCLAIAIYGAGWAAWTVYQMVQMDRYSGVAVFDTYLYTPGQHSGAFSDGTSRWGECRNIILFFGIPYLLPSLIVMVCLVIQARALLKKSMVQSVGGTVEDDKKAAVLTVFLISLLFFVCNTLYIYYPISFCAATDMNLDLDQLNARTRTRYFWRFMTGVVAPFVNAAFNPLVLVGRNPALRSRLRITRTMKTMRTHVEHSMTAIRNGKSSPKPGSSPKSSPKPGPRALSQGQV